MALSYGLYPYPGNIPGYPAGFTGRLVERVPTLGLPLPGIFDRFKLLFNELFHTWINPLRHIHVGRSVMGLARLGTARRCFDFGFALQPPALEAAGSTH